MRSLIFATNNQHKVDEVKIVLGDHFRVITLTEAGITIDIPEPHDTLEANATEKSTTIFNLTGSDCFSEDTGLEVAALNGEPGVKSARYAGGDGNQPIFEANIDKLLHRLGNQENRRARFRTIISLILDKKEYQFEGICEGVISRGRVGNGGFGYDPVFIPNGFNRSFAEMSPLEKSSISHRKKALTQLIQFLQSYSPHSV